MKLLLLALVLCSSLNSSLACFVATGDCPNENVTFWLYSKDTQNNPVQIDPLQPDRWDFSAQLPIKILLHGYTGDKDFFPNSVIRPALLSYDNVYVISIDFANIVPAECYLESVQSVPLISKCLAQLINNLIRARITTNERIHIIGYSLGSHIAGQAANYLDQKPKRITGLEPAKPLFVMVDESLRLDRSDAEFVDVLHTDVMNRGMLRAVGHVDFYANLGHLKQPGCENSTVISCSHDRAPEYYAETIGARKAFWAGRSDNTQIRTPMGYYVSPAARGIFFFQTNSKSPFALGMPTDPASFQVRLDDAFLTRVEIGLERLVVMQVADALQTPPLIDELDSLYASFV